MLKEISSCFDELRFCPFNMNTNILCQVWLNYMSSDHTWYCTYSLRIWFSINLLIFEDWTLRVSVELHTSDILAHFNVTILCLSVLWERADLRFGLTWQKYHSCSQWKDNRCFPYLGGHILDVGYTLPLSGKRYSPMMNDFNIQTSW